MESTAATGFAEAVDLTAGGIGSASSGVGKASHLPAWYLEMKRSLESSKASHARLESHLHELRGSTEALTMKIRAVDAGDAARPNVADDAATARASSSRQPKGSLLNRIPSDVLGCVLRFLFTSEIVKLGMASKELRCLCASNMFWKIELRNRCPHLSAIILQTLEQCRMEIVAHAIAAHDCIAFVKTMKDQRSVPRHATADPRRFLRSDKSVTHPLPVFSHVQSDLPDSVMSQSDTFSADMHSMALRALSTMLRITSHEEDPIHELLYRDGVVTVLVSLLANESGHVQELSCGILANLLVWEARRLPCRGRSLSSSKQSVLQQIFACDGRNKLHALLTSPSASVNLAGPGERTVTFTGATELRTRSSVQGLSCRSASRALVCLYHPCDPIPAPSRPIFVHMATPDSKESDFVSIHKSDRFSDISVQNTSFLSRRKFGEKSVKSLGNTSVAFVGNNCHSARDERDQLDIPLRSQRKKLTAKSVPVKTNLEKAVIKPSEPTSASCQSFFKDKERLAVEPIIPKHLDCSISRHWVFTYYFKSGALHEIISAQLVFSPNCVMYGRGLDSMGSFFLHGSAVIDISGTVWLIHKVYTRDLQISLHDWISVPFNIDDLASELSTTGGLSARRAHISHSAYWSKHVNVMPTFDAPQNVASQSSVCHSNMKVENMEAGPVTW